MTKKKKKNTNLINLNDDLKESNLNIENKKEVIDKEIKVKKNTEKVEKSKLNIFLLIICFSLIIYLGISNYLNNNYDNLVIFIKNETFLLLLLIVFFILFKVNNKKIIPYIALITLILSGYTIFNLSYSYSLNNNAYVLDFINKDINEVIEFTTKYDLKLTMLYEYSDTVLKNHVIMQEYGINTLINDIKDFQVVISNGPNYEKEVIVSNLTGLSYDEVMKYIKDNFLNNVEIEFIKSDKPRDTVIEQVGSGSLKRNSLIKLTFSLGETELEDVLVKDLQGLSLFEATAYLKRNAINYEIVYDYSDKIEKNYVISQDIINKIVEDKITLTVSKGKKIIVPNLEEMSNLEITSWALNNNIKLEYIEVYDKESALGSILEMNKNVGDIIDEDSKLIITISKGSMVMPKINDLSEFKQWANQYNINYEEIYEFSESVESGKLINCSHKEGAKLVENETIILTISKGKSVTIPNLVGKSKSQIQTICQNNNLSCTFTYGGLTNSTAKDISIKQSKPRGSIVSAGTNVLITLSNGTYVKVNVPNLVGKSKNEINSICNNLGINCNFKYNDSYTDTAKDIAIFQDKTGTVIQGSTVNITLSIGPAKTYTIVIDGSLLSLGNPEQTKKTLQTKLESACPGVYFNFSFKAVNTGIGYLNPNSDVLVGENKLVQGKTYNVIINSSN